MALVKAVGPSASARKYDILSAMLTFGLSQNKRTQRQVMRLIALITTRYNWRTDDLTIGQREIAKLWSVDPRTVKREMAVFRDLGWIVIKKQGARGRVSSYAISFDKILTDTKPAWPNIGPDFEERAGALLPEIDASARVVRVDFSTDRNAAITLGDDPSWNAVQNLLQKKDPQVFDNWYHQLVFVRTESQAVILKAPNRFVARYVEMHLKKPLLSAVQSCFPETTKIVLNH